MRFDKSSNIVNDTHSKLQIPFGNLNITVFEPQQTDTSEIREKLNIKQDYKITKPKSHEESESESESGSGSDSEGGSDPEDELRVKVEDCTCKNKNKEEFVEVDRKRVFKQLCKFSKNLDEIGEWPDKTDILCWWCCHKFEDIPIPSVVKYDERRRRYNLRGVFCSWECSAAYTLEKSKI